MPVESRTFRFSDELAITAAWKVYHDWRRFSQLLPLVAERRRPRLPPKARPPTASLEEILRGISGIRCGGKRKPEPAVATARHPRPGEKALVPTAPGPSEACVAASRTGYLVLASIAGWWVSLGSGVGLGLGCRGRIFRSGYQPQTKASRATAQPVAMPLGETIEEAVIDGIGFGSAAFGTRRGHR